MMPGDPPQITPPPPPPRIPPPASPPPRAAARSALLWIATAAATLALVAGAGFALHKSGILGSAGSPPPPAGVTPSDHYLVFLSLVEVENVTPRGHGWDMTDGGPDVKYEIWWRGNRVFESSAREDTLVATWDQAEVGIKDILHGISAESAVKAARITAEHGEKLEFRVIDSDSVANDEIGRWEVAVDTLRTGEQVWTAPAAGVRKAVCRVLRSDHSGR
jgi:hypothetical protein